MKAKPKFWAVVIARERGQAPRTIRRKWFRTQQAASNFCDRWNKKHCPPRRWNDIPDYYVAAYLAETKETPTSEPKA